MPRLAKLTIRRAVAADIERLLVIENLSFRQHRFRRRDFEYHLRNPSSILLVAEASGEVVGYIAGIIYHAPKNRIAKLYSMAVHPEWRGHRVGSLLLKRFEKESAARRSRSITLEVRRTNRRARALYFDSGYKVDSILKRYYNPHSDAVRMRKRLNTEST